MHTIFYRNALIKHMGQCRTANMSRKTCVVVQQIESNPVPVKQPWTIQVNKSQEYTKKDYVQKTNKQTNKKYQR